MASLKFWKPGTSGPGSTLDRATETEGNVVPSAPAYSSLSVQAQRERLPIFKHSVFIISIGYTVVDVTLSLQEKNCSTVWKNTVS